MATGTEAGLLQARPAQSYFKHRVLDHYLAPFSAMVGSASRGRRVVLLDGYAGNGRYDNGEPGSAELLLQIAQRSTRTNVDPILVEKDQAAFERLAKVAEEYAAAGVPATALQGRVESHLDAIIRGAEDAPLMMFLDPTGAVMPFDHLARVLGQDRQGQWPPTEVLINFSAELTRRVGGQVCKVDGMSRSYPAMDGTCGGGWWRSVVRDAVEEGEGQGFELAAERVAFGYAERLAAAAGMESVVIPVRKETSHQPLYHLVFLTRSPFGIWVMADAVGRARVDWLKAAVDEIPDDGLLTGAAVLEAQLQDEARRVQLSIENNLRALLRTYSGFLLVNEAREVFGDSYGIATERVIARAVRAMAERAELVSIPTQGGSFRKTFVKRR